MLHGANAFRPIAAGYPIGWRAVLHGLKINACAADVTLGSAQRLGGHPAIGGAVRGEQAAFPTSDDAADREFGDICCGVAGSIGSSLGGLTCRSPDGPHHCTDTGADIGNALLHPIPECVEEAGWF